MIMLTKHHFGAFFLTIKQFLVKKMVKVAKKFNENNLKLYIKQENIRKTTKLYIKLVDKHILLLYNHTC